MNIIGSFSAPAVLSVEGGPVLTGAAYEAAFHEGYERSVPVAQSLALKFDTCAALRKAVEIRLSEEVGAGMSQAFADGVVAAVDHVWVSFPEY